MLLEEISGFNALSDKLRKELTEKIESFGKSVRYKFNISNINPDPTKYNGDVVWPNTYTLDPTVFNIKDPYDGKMKKIALVESEEVDERGVKRQKFRKIRVGGSSKGVYELNLADSPEAMSYAMFLELHPKMIEGKFLDKGKQQIFSRVNESALATEQRKERSARKLAMDTAEKMSDAEVVEFSNAMAWDSTDELLVLRNKIEELAERTPQMFNDLVSDKKMKYQAAVKRAIDKKIWSYDPASGRLTWVSTGQVITVSVAPEGGIPYDLLAEWFMTSGKNGDNAYNKLVSLEKPELTT